MKPEDYDEILSSSSEEDPTKIKADTVIKGQLPTNQSEIKVDKKVKRKHQSPKVSLDAQKDLKSPLMNEGTQSKKKLALQA